MIEKTKYTVNCGTQRHVGIIIGRYVRVYETTSNLGYFTNKLFRVIRTYEI